MKIVIPSYRRPDNVLALSEVIPELHSEMKKLSEEAYPYYEELKKHCI